MKCPFCQSMIQSNICQKCGFTMEPCDWTLITRAYPPADIIIKSALEANDIPVKCISREVAQMPFSIGPMAEVLLYVPSSLLREAKEIVNNQNNSEGEN